MAERAESLGAAYQTETSLIWLMCGGFPVFPEGSYCLNFRSCKFPSLSWLIIQDGEWAWSVCVSPKCETHVQWIMAAAATCVSWLQLPKPPAVPVLLGSTCRRMERPAHLVKSKLYNTFVHVWNMQPINNCYLKHPWLCSKFIKGNTSTFRSFLLNRYGDIIHLIVF